MCGRNIGVQKNCDFFYSVTYICYLKKTSTHLHIIDAWGSFLKPIVAHGVKADQVSSVRWKDILDVDCTDRVTLAAYCCIKEDKLNFDCKLQALPDLLIAF